MQPRKQHLVNTAMSLFNESGYHATGIDLILAQAKVSKATLYKHFRSKDELILAALAQRHDQVLAMFTDKMMSVEATSAERVLSVFDALHEWFQSDDFYGCNFINASAEYADAEHPIHQLATQHKQVIVDLIQENLSVENKHKADQIGILVEGAIVMAHTRGMKKAAQMAKKMGESLIVS